MAGYRYNAGLANIQAFGLGMMNAYNRAVRDMGDLKLAEADMSMRRESMDLQKASAGFNMMNQTYNTYSKIASDSVTKMPDGSTAVKVGDDRLAGQYLEGVAPFLTKFTDGQGAAASQGSVPSYTTPPQGSAPSYPAGTIDPSAGGVDSSMGELERAVTAAGGFFTQSGDAVRVGENGKLQELQVNKVGDKVIIRDKQISTNPVDLVTDDYNVDGNISEFVKKRFTDFGDSYINEFGGMKKSSMAAAFTSFLHNMHENEPELFERLSKSEDGMSTLLDKFRSNKDVVDMMDGVTLDRTDLTFGLDYDSLLATFPGSETNTNNKLLRGRIRDEVFKSKTEIAEDFANIHGRAYGDDELSLVNAAQDTSRISQEEQIRMGDKWFGTKGMRDAVYAEEIVAFDSKQGKYVPTNGDVPINARDTYNKKLSDYLDKCRAEGKTSIDLKSKEWRPMVSFNNSNGGFSINIGQGQWIHGATIPEVETRLFQMADTIKLDQLLDEEFVETTINESKPAKPQDHETPLYPGGFHSGMGSPYGTFMY